ncbi:hypothetical protein [Staphylococcus pettenkoferi]|uniref:hypothetical protein n=1 Tax=Staphylococcus pettenkoferi TaxID=170573 RepID=UPI002276BBC1|nr:hypothetical protein [Staphylococcus pettenkoferi]MCY1563866.1 hypothetical protein [Staphylococcus pettenkoferi]
MFLNDLPYKELSKIYYLHKEDIELMKQANFSLVSKNMFERAYPFSVIEYESDVEVLTLIQKGDMVWHNSEEYTVTNVDHRLNLVELESEERFVFTGIGNVDRDVTPVEDCMGDLIRLDTALADYVLNNLEEVSHMGYEIYRPKFDEPDIYLGIPSVQSDADVEYHTKLFMCWKFWQDKMFEAMKEEVHSYEFG